MPNSALRRPPSAFLPALLLATFAALPLTAAEEVPAAPGEAAQTRLREGTKITEQLGTFKIRGDRATFYPEGDEQGYCGLENLNLARIYQMVSESPDELCWVVSGMITEYNGSNYLLVTRAVRKTKPLDAQPRRTAAAVARP